MDEIGPVDYAIIAFPGSKFTGRIAPALAELVHAGTVRIIDAAVVSRDETGIVAGFELTELRSLSSRMRRSSFEFSEQPPRRWAC